MQNKICICQGIPEIVNALGKLGYKVLSPVPEAALDEEVSAHADMLVCISGEKTAVVHEGQSSLMKQLSECGVDVISATHAFGAYPKDVGFNVAVIKGICVGLKRAVNPVLLSQVSDYDFIDVKQGYAKCSTCFAGENAVITEDEGIKAAFEKKGFDVLLISKGDVYLSEKHYGFFGGATGAPDRNTLLIAGELSTHRDGDVIRKFLEYHGVRPVELVKGQIRDVGSILPV